MLPLFGTISFLFFITPLHFHLPWFVASLTKEFLKFLYCHNYRIFLTSPNNTCFLRNTTWKIISYLLSLLPFNMNSAKFSKSKRWKQNCALWSVFCSCICFSDTLPRKTGSRAELQNMRLCISAEQYEPVTDCRCQLCCFSLT